MARNHVHLDEQARERLLKSDDHLSPHSTLVGVAWHLLLLTIICIFFLIGLAIGLNSPTSSNDRSCFVQTSKPSPLLSDLEISWHEVQFNGSLLKENEYRRRAGPEVDAAWEALGINCQFSHRYQSLQQLTL